MQTNIVSKLTIGAVAVVMVAGCSDAPPAANTPAHAPVIVECHYYTIYREVLDEHVYFAAIRSHTVQLLHSESCTNTACQPVTLEKLRKGHNFVQPTPLP